MNRVFIASIAVLSSFTILHSGRTDGYGGHYDNSAGEYHYHHGYSAHDHYDMNGDGIADCPYTFKDNTSNKSNESKYDSYSDWIKAERGIADETEYDELDPRNYDTFTEWSNAEHGKTETETSNVSKQTNNKKHGSILETVDIVLCCITIFYMPWVIKEATEKLKEKFNHRK
jgi:hypothetical protein